MDLDQLWKNTQEELKIVLAPAVFQTFVSQTQLISLKDQTATIACPNSYLVQMNNKRYYDLFKSALDNQTKKNIIINFIDQQPIEIQNSPKKTSTPLFSKNYSTTSYDPNLNPKYTFDNLIVGNSNNFAFAAAQGIIKNPGLSYNPFFIWGGVGVGKTHLMQAIGHQLLKDNPDMKIKYFPAETFGNELVDSLKTKNMTKFKNKYRKLDCILVDDIQFIAGKEYTKEEFFHTFNALHMNGKQIILTSDRKPDEIGQLEDRLVSRFMGGLTVDIQLPDYEMRVAIIKQNTEKKGIKMTNEATLFLAQNIQSNIRDIEGKLQKLFIQSLTDKVGEIDISFIQQQLNINTNDFSQNQDRASMSPRHIISVCAKFFQVKTSDLCGKSRKKDLVQARHITAHFLLDEINLPLEKVGRLLGGRDHTSIMHARDKIHHQLSTNPQTKQLINQIHTLL
ncbi:chromosomal replication initiator protein DnaA [Patescibacteria group bacterium]|nr:chromosomal replication initiator protein DnaA [Patescibacteria group bacterium]MCG2701701.1 chromosomal replication initiator protein DnaA [Candidatus Parcubacteria bacterium]MBU4265364.1 chromosomal replication initiator protein DnaA [Patescibacteria group bacterium]MBU4390316.1 chromosomal replication initiator protein DnaA [Patescibacteria group bacterium]MBU4396563.1 chromosomal replication initiator protein DnaA [Patescibacteria group bacterium]